MKIVGWTFVGSLLLVFVSISAFANFDPIDFWKSAPRGANMASKNPATDFKAAAEYGTKLIRFGATGSPADFTNLIAGNGDNETWNLSPENLRKLSDLLNTVRQNKLKAVFTLADIPGRRWVYRKKDCRIWKEARFQNAFIQAWKTIATALKGNSSVVGYDLMNEPYLPNAQTCSGVTAKPSDLNRLYRSTVAAIRMIDPLVPIILESPEMASPDALSALPILDGDERIIYSFHYYEPFSYFSAPENQGKLSYPGRMPNEDGSFTYWNKAQHQKVLSPVVLWQKANNIQPYKIYVGEFGVWRKAQGAQQYLQDLINLFAEAGWSWSYYAFREDDWDNVDLEKVGTNPSRQSTPLFKVIQKGFQ